ncbi:MAG TPA: hypothetical protein VF941_00350, partial [Clostridia bacterium]
FGNSRWISFIRIDNDFKEYNYFTHGFDAARVTLAHEFHHAIQMGCYRYGNSDEVFFHELTSTSMEEFVFSDVNDYYNYLVDYFHYPEDAFYRHGGYDLAIWNLMLKDLYGFDIIKRQWELFTDNHALSAINTSLNEHQSSFKDALNEFGIWTFYTGYRSISNKYFKESEFYPLIRPVVSTEFNPAIFPVTIKCQPLSNNFIKVLFKGQNATDTLTVKITDGDVLRALDNPYTLLDAGLFVFSDSADGSRRIVNNYFSKLTGSMNVISEVDFFNDKIVNGSQIINSEADYAYPDPFYYQNRLNNNQVNIPVSNNDLKSADLRIYSSGMKLVYSDRKTIITDPQTDKYVVNWNGMDSDGQRLPTGIYIYVTYSNGNIKKGKLAIINK